MRPDEAKPRYIARPLIEYPPYYRCHLLLNRLWSKSDSARYVKREWLALEAAISLLARPDQTGAAEAALDREIAELDAAEADFECLDTLTDAATAVEEAFKK